MYSTYSASKQRRYRYYVCYRSQQKLEGYCTSRAVSAQVVEEALVEGIRRVGINPEVLAETARLARQQLAEALMGLGLHARATAALRSVENEARRCGSRHRGSLQGKSKVKPIAANS
jgi:hypothetical protein